MKNKELSRIFAEIADALEFKGDSLYRVVAYRSASRVLDDLTEDIESLAKEGRLTEIPRVGEGIANKIEEYLTTGKLKKHQEALSGVPEGLLTLLRIQNLGPKTLALAHSVGELRWMRFGVGIARRGWLEKEDVINTLSYKEISNIFKWGTVQ